LIAKVFTAFEKVKALAALAFSEASRRGELEMVVRHVRLARRIYSTGPSLRLFDEANISRKREAADGNDKT